MRIAGCLFGYGLVVQLLAPGLLGRLTRRGGSPRLAVGAWLAALASVLGAWLVAAVAAVTEIVAPGASARLLAHCLAVRREVPAPVRMLAAAGIGLGAGALLVLGCYGVARLAWAARLRRRRHAEGLAVIGTPAPGWGAVLVDSPRPAAYCLAGRPGLIVVSTAAADRLAGPELAAVLAHEQAHLAGHHHLLNTLTQGLARAFGRLRLFPAAATEIGRLLEMRADDVAARRHGAHTLVSALLALATPASPTPDPAPAGALSASGPGAADRAIRLLEPASRTARYTATAGLLAATAALLAGPALAVLGNLCTLALT